MPDRTEGTVIYSDKKPFHFFPKILIPFDLLARFLQTDPKQRVNRKKAHAGQKGKAVIRRRKKNKIAAASRRRNR